MYERHFGLGPRPFGETTSPGAYVPLPSHEAAIRRLRYGLEQGRGPAQLVGPPGSGKTLLARRLADELGLPAAHLVFPAMPAVDFLSYLADELDSPRTGSIAVSDALRRVRVVLRAGALRGRPTLLIVDEAHLIDDPATFEGLRLLLNLVADGPPGLLLLLVGGPDLPDRVPSSLADRLTARARVGPLTRRESDAYVIGRLAHAGAGAALFDAEALGGLARESDGLPRRINRLADLALLVAYGAGDDRVGAVAVEVAARESAFDPVGV